MGGGGVNYQRLPKGWLVESSKIDFFDCACSIDNAGTYRYIHFRKFVNKNIATGPFGTRKRDVVHHVERTMMRVDRSVWENKPRPSAAARKASPGIPDAPPFPDAKFNEAAGSQ